MSKQPVILLAEPEATIRESVEMILTDEGYTCRTVSDTDSLLDSLYIHPSDLIIADVQLFSEEIQQIILILDRHKSRPPTLITLGYDQLHHMSALKEFDVSEYIIKPFHFEDMLERVQQLLFKTEEKEDK
ncbi:MAG TPA: response regulator [Balneolaceae bacterium]|nr:response regulator [Balneolaceae bacterium]